MSGPKAVTRTPIADQKLGTQDAQIEHLSIGSISLLRRDYNRLQTDSSLSDRDRPWDLKPILISRSEGSL